ncbi:MAG TPA: sulfite dehydrogenase, partial [Xanthobacteraceae bacterium]
MKIRDDGFVIYDEKSQRMADEMVVAEVRHMARRRQEGDDCACTDGMFPRASASRRGFLFAAGSVAGLAGTTAALAQKAPPGAVYYDVPADPTRELGRPVAGDGGYGSRSQFETEVRVR